MRGGSIRPALPILRIQQNFFEKLLWKKDYWKDRKYLNYDMKIEFDIPKNMKHIIDLLEDLYYNNGSYVEYDAWPDVLLSIAKQDLLWGQITENDFNNLCKKFKLF